MISKGITIPASTTETDYHHLDHALTMIQNGVEMTFADGAKFYLN